LVRGLMTDDEWVFFEPFLTGRSEQGGRPARNHRRVLDGIFWIARTGAPWHDLPEELGNWNSVWRQFRRWSASGLWDVLLQALADTGGDAETLQMIDSTIIRAHHCAAGAKGGTPSTPCYLRALAIRYSAFASTGPPLSARSRRTSSRTARRISSGSAASAWPVDAPPRSKGP
jgi:transposase